MLRRCDRDVARLWHMCGQSGLDLVFAPWISGDAVVDLRGSLPLSTGIVEPTAQTTTVGSRQRQHLRRASRLSALTRGHAMISVVVLQTRSADDPTPQRECPGRPLLRRQVPGPCQQPALEKSSDYRPVLRSIVGCPQGSPRRALQNDPGRAVSHTHARLQSCRTESN